MSDITLDPHERRLPVLAKLASHIDERLAEHRALNDSTALDQVQTAIQRGRIAELKYIQNLLATGES